MASVFIVYMYVKFDCLSILNISENIIFSLTFACLIGVKESMKCFQIK